VSTRAIAVINTDGREEPHIKKVGVHFQDLLQLKALDVNDLAKVHIGLDSLNDLHRCVDRLCFARTDHKSDSRTLELIMLSGMLNLQ